tara:strand:+ start:1153 stop:2421 length:1269 start_codon:yes stop_codon:yes gene_type:complete
MFKILTSLLLRFSGAIAKFVLTLYLAKFLSPQDLGEIALLIALVTISTQIIGMDVHYFNSRIISSGSKTIASNTIKSQMFLHLISYIFLIPFLSFLVYIGFLKTSFFFLILVIIIFEHLSIEITRFLQFILRPNTGALILFIRNALYVIIFISISLSDKKYLSIDFLLVSWTFSIFIAFLLGIFFIRDYLLLQLSKTNKDLSYYLDLIKRSSPFLISSTFFMLLQFLDRFVLNYFDGEYLVGILFFYAGIATSIHLFANYTVGVFHGPIAIKKFRNEGVDSYLKEKKIMINRSVIAVVVALVLAITLIEPLIEYVGRVEYIDYINIFYIFLLAQVLLVISDFFQLDLYVRNFDKAIMKASISAGIFAFIFQIILVKNFSIYGAATATTIGVIMLTIFRYIFYKYDIKKNPDSKLEIKFKENE